MSIRIGRWYKYRDSKGREYTGKVRNIARVRSGAVLAFLDTGKGLKGCPVSKYGTWICLERA